MILHCTSFLDIENWKIETQALDIILVFFSTSVVYLQFLGKSYNFIISGCIPTPSNEKLVPPTSLIFMRGTT